LNHLYRKNILWFALLWIGIYVVGFSCADSLSAQLGTEKLVTAVFGILLSVMLLFWLHKHSLTARFGLCAVKGSRKPFLWFLPLAILVSANLWLGVTINLAPVETALHIVSMLCVGFLEEIIFRGFLFHAIAKDNLNSAIHISAVTFGIGHIVNLLNGAPILSTLLQIAYAVAIGYLFTLIFLKSGSLIPCIITHGIFNALSVFSPAPTPTQEILMAVALILLPAAYALWLIKQIPTNAIEL